MIRIKILQFKIGDHVSILKYKNIFAKGYAPNSTEEVKKLLELFMKKNCRSIIKKNLE